MTTPAKFPTSIWDGSSLTRGATPVEPTLQVLAAPDGYDWNQAVAEIIAIEKAVGPLGATPQPANTVLAGPISGVSAPGAYRQLVSSDLPASAALTGVPTAPTPATADNSTTIATTAFVKAQGSSLAIGGTVTGGTPGRVLFEGFGSVLADDRGLTYAGGTFKAGLVNATVTPAMTSNTQPAPFVASASSIVNTANAEFMAFDQNSGTEWLANGTSGWVRIDLGASGSAVVTQYGVTGSNYDVTISPKSWTFEGSPDGTIWTILDTQTNAAAWTLAQTRIFPVANTTAYRYYRLNISVNEGHASYAGIAELTLTQSVGLLTVTSNGTTTIAGAPPAVTDSSTSVATTAWVQGFVSNAINVLQFPNQSPYGHVNHGPFWPEPFTATGTIGVTNGTAVVTGSGTKFLTEILPGQSYYFGGDTTSAAYKILYVTSDTSLVLASNYTGTTIASGSTMVLCLGTGFWWEAWLCPLAGDGYLISEGYGGGHALLWGLIGGKITGNIWNGTVITSYGGNYTVNTGEWVHAVVRWDGSNVYIYINGILDGINAFPGPRLSNSSSGGGRTLYVGGSDHQNLPMKLAYIRAWDTLEPVTAVGSGVYYAFTPERFAALATTPARGSYPVDFFCDYTQISPGAIKDISPAGYMDVVARQRIFHHGRRFQANIGGGSLQSSPDGTQNVTGPVPTWVADSSCPYGQLMGSPLPLENIPGPTTPTAGAKIFDSFGRRNQTLAFQAVPTLGSTEAGSLGIQTWQYASAGSWGILGGHAVYIGGWGAASVAWVPNNSGDMDVRVNASAVGQTPLGLAFRVQDANNYWSFFSRTAGGVSTLALGQVQAGTVSIVAYYGPIPNFQQLRIVTGGTTITGYYDTTQVFTTTSSLFQTATGAGMAFTDSIIYGGSNVNRIKSFAAL